MAALARSYTVVVLMQVSIYMHVHGDKCCACMHACMAKHVATDPKAHALDLKSLRFPVVHCSELA